MDDLPGNMTKPRDRGKHLWHGETACPHAAGTGRIGRSVDGFTQAAATGIGLQPTGGKLSMKLLFRRNFLKLAGALITMPALPQLASALDYPTRPTKIVAGFAAGGGVDITARLIGQWLADHLGQPFVVENRTGAGGNIGTETVVNAAADGWIHAAAGDRSERGQRFALR